jgi:hypothetical protein
VLFEVKDPEDSDSNIITLESFKEILSFYNDLKYVSKTATFNGEEMEIPISWESICIKSEGEGKECYTYNSVLAFFFDQNYNVDLSSYENDA